MPDIPAGIARKKGEVGYAIENHHIDSTDATTAVTLWSATTGKKHHVTDILISADAEMSVEIQDGGTTILKAYLAANGGLIQNFQTPLQGSTGTALNVKASVAGNVTVTVTGYEE